MDIPTYINKKVGQKLHYRSSLQFIIHLLIFETVPNLQKNTVVLTYINNDSYNHVSKL